MSHKPLIILSLALTLLVSFDYLAAWTVPPSNPPSGNIAAPLNTGTTEQIKDGVLGVGGLGVFGGTTLQSGSPTILFNDTDSTYLGTQRNFWLHVNGSKFHLIGDRDDNGNWSSPEDYLGGWPLEMNLGAVRSEDWIKFSNRVQAESYCDINGNNCLVPSRTLMPNCAAGQTIVMGGTGQWVCGNTASTPTAPSATYEWRTTAWGSCQNNIGPFYGGCGTYTFTGTQTRTVYCVNAATGATVSDSMCTAARPSNSQTCTGSGYTDSGCRCFIAGTKVIMADGTEKNIEDVEIGEFLLGKDGAHNEVLGFERPMLGERELYSINGGPAFVTPAHPFLTTEGWKSISMAEIHRENTTLVGELAITELQVGDWIITADGTTELVTSIVGSDAEDQQLYNFILSGDRTYYVNGFLTHNEFSRDEYDPETFVAE